METLISDCFPPIFSYLSLADLFNLRQVSRRLKQEVEDYLPNVRSLPLYLTTPRTPEEIAQYELMFTPPKPGEKRSYEPTTHRNLNFHNCVRKLSFGISGLATFEDRTILQNQKHFRRFDFLVLNHSSALPKFLKLVKKHCPKIQKLALVIDNCKHYLPKMCQIFKAFPAIKVLLVENTLQDSCRPLLRKGDVDELSNFLAQKPTSSELKIPRTVYCSILNLKNLQELFFFPKQYSTLAILRGGESIEESFIRLLVARLRVLHFKNSYGIPSRRLFRISFGQMISDVLESPLEELACGEDDWLIPLEFIGEDRLNLPTLKKFFVLNASMALSWGVSRQIPPKTRSKLKFVEISGSFFITPESMRNLNSLTGLENFHCQNLEFVSIFISTLSELRVDEHGKYYYSNPWEDEDYYDDEIVAEEMKNWTVKHLQIANQSWTSHGLKNRDIRRWSKYFVALETCTILEPEYSVVRISDLRN